MCACAGRIFPTILLSHAQVAAAFSRMLPDAPECFSSWYQYLWPQDGHLSFWPSGLLAYWIQNGLDRDRRRGCSRSTSYKLSRGIPQCTRLRFAAEMLRRGPGARPPTCRFPCQGAARGAAPQRSEGTDPPHKQLQRWSRQRSLAEYSRLHCCRMRRLLQPSPGCFRMLPNAFRAGTSTCGPKMATCPSGRLAYWAIGSKTD